MSASPPNPDSADSRNPIPTMRRVWDLPVRICHWGLVLAVLGAYVSNRAGTQYFTYHLWCGYAVVVLVGFRIVWGIVGTYHARFWNFVRGPVATTRYLLATLRGRPEHYAGHNPLGAVMVIALIARLLVQGVTGPFANDEILNFGPLYAYVSNEQSLALTSLHEQLFYWIIGAVALHVIAVVLHRVFKNENLVKAMFTGRKPAHIVDPALEIRSSRLWIAVLILVAIVGALSWYVYQAPEPTYDSFM